MSFIEKLYQLAIVHEAKKTPLWIAASLSLLTAISLSLFVTSDGRFVSSMATALALISLQTASLAFAISFFRKQLSKTSGVSSSHMFVVMQELLAGIIVLAINLILPILILVIFVGAFS